MCIYIYVAFPEVSSKNKKPGTSQFSLEESSRKSKICAYSDWRVGAIANPPSYSGAQKDESQQGGSMQIRSGQSSLYVCVMLSKDTHSTQSPVTH